ncbi:dynamin family [Apiospora rasikravindrae]|uniref:Dynamin family n=1 Tax=Apiospora rasikravindrae TaxID=990691 RepID=A0ABR1TC23_9PEZI
MTANPRAHVTRTSSVVSRHPSIYPPSVMRTQGRRKTWGAWNATADPMVASTSSLDGHDDAGDDPKTNDAALAVGNGGPHSMTNDHLPVLVPVSSTGSCCPCTAAKLDKGKGKAEYFDENEEVGANGAPAVDDRPHSAAGDLPVLAPEPSIVGSPRTMSDNAWDDSIPWPGNTYMIIEKATGRPITLKENGMIYLPGNEEGNEEDAETMSATPAEPAPTADNTWYCAESQNYFGFLNRATGRYMGHNVFRTMQASAFSLRAWELFTAKPHPKGGYHLMTPLWANALQVVDIAPDGRHLIRRMHGGVLWEFRKVEK